MIAVAEKNDGEQVVALTAKASVFSQEEIDCVRELWQEYIEKGADTSGYHFLVYRQDGQVLGYACYGVHALTDATYDLYWIAVDPDQHGQGVGRAVIQATEQAIKEKGGRLIVVETSGKEAYSPARRFYAAAGYGLAAIIKDFYTDGDDLVMYTKHLRR
ncbi:MAG: GNAT family N-acetyltransferase [Anaerolineales bacterium]|nr:GNAT family N-acetyltransferase [Anaerolineales bacterium]